MQSTFVHLRLHSEFSIVDGLVRIPNLMKDLVAKGMNAIALTDVCNLFAAVKFFEAAIAAGIKPILGAELSASYQAKPEAYSSLVLLCQNREGYKNLTCLISKAYQEGQRQDLARIFYEWLPTYSQGLIALSGGMRGAIGQALLAEDEELALRLASQFSQLFPGRFYLEVQRLGRPNEAAYNASLIQLAETLNLPLVATNEVCFLAREDFDAHEARVCIRQGQALANPQRSRAYSAEQYLRSAKEMQTLFQDLPQALENTQKIAQRCNLILNLGNNYLPQFPLPPGMDEKAYLSLLAKEGLAERLKLIFQARPEAICLKADYEERLQVELDVINNMGFPGYFLIVADFIQWAKNNGVPVGPGRGSGAGSLVAYALKITDLDPLLYELLFERFLNPERVSMPDFDVDFCMEGRDRVIEYVAEKYGRQSVSQIITFGTMAAKAVVRDVGRVLGHPYGFVDKIAKLIPFELGITLSKALEEEELARRYQDEEDVRELIDLALKLEGLTRNAGKHAGGVVIAPSGLTDFTAIYCEPDSKQLVSQFDKDDVEAAGLVKFDFLGLRTLTIIDWALKRVNKTREEQRLPPIDIALIPTDDPAPYELLKSCQTTAVFQLESRGMKELIHRLQPDCFEEIIALVALFRPGPLQSGMVDDFIDRKHGRAKVEYPHPDLEPILRPTYGVILYQEQVMQIAQVLANYTLGAADLLRRAMGKKKPEEMAKQRSIFVEGAIARGVKAEVASHIFDLMEKFAGYGFNKSHSAAYALLAYQTAWLKAHYPAAFMAAVISSDMDKTEKVVVFIHECKQMQLSIKAPCINQSNYLFTSINDRDILYGLGAIKGVGESAIQVMVEERQRGGPFKNLFDFCVRLDLRKVNRRVLEALIKSGAMDVFGKERAILFASLEKALKLAEKRQQNQTSGQHELFGLFEEVDGENEYLFAQSQSPAERLSGEKETLGFYISGHPASVYAFEFKEYIKTLGSLSSSRVKKAWICGLVANVKRILTKSGRKLSIISLEDQEGSIDVVVFSEIYDGLAKPVESGKIYLIEGELSEDSFSGGLRMTAMQILNLEEARTYFFKGLSLTLSFKDTDKLPRLKELLMAHPGESVIRLNYRGVQASVKLNVSRDWSVCPSDELLSALRDILGPHAVVCERLMTI